MSKGSLIYVLFVAGWIKITFSRKIEYDAYYVAYYGSGYTKALAYPAHHKRPRMPADRFVKDQRQDVLDLMEDMLKDALRTRKKMEKVRRVHHKRLPYQIGFILGIIRETYQRMMNTYIQAKNRYENKDPYLMPTMFYGDFVNLEYFMIMEDIHFGEIKINRLVDLIEKTSMENFEASYILRRAKQQDAEANKILRQMKALEAAYKGEVRRQYRLLRLGLPANRTKTRFQKPENWVDYNGEGRFKQRP